VKSESIRCSKHPSGNPRQSNMYHTWGGSSVVAGCRTISCSSVARAALILPTRTPTLQRGALERDQTSRHAANASRQLPIRLRSTHLKRSHDRSGAMNRMLSSDSASASPARAISSGFMPPLSRNSCRAAVQACSDQQARASCAACAWRTIQH
jgi:hypothetical protein